MIMKLKWIQLVNQNNVGNYALNQQGMLALIDEVDTLFTASYSDSESANDGRIRHVYDEMLNFFASNEEDNYWADMPIYTSSWIYRDKSPFGEIILRLTQYLGFYKKILKDKGLARSVVTHREYSNDGESDGTNKQLNSDVPQKVITAFEDAIQYVSTANKNEDHTESSTSGESDLTVDSKSWDEAEKNMKYIFYNDLVNYIRDIPRWIYAQYSTDSLPTDALVEETFKYFKDMYERR